MKNYFSFQELTNGWAICPNWKEFGPDSSSISGSFNLIACRISGLDWPQWLRYCRQNGAKLYGKNSKYVMAVWDKPNTSFLKQLNERANALAKYVNFKELSL